MDERCLSNIHVQQFSRYLHRKEKSDATFS